MLILSEYNHPVVLTLSNYTKQFFLLYLLNGMYTEHIVNIIVGYALATTKPVKNVTKLRHQRPSFTYTNDMFGSLNALHEAYKNVSMGHVEAAIVGVASTIQHPLMAVSLNNMNLLSPDSVTRVFDKNANGYGRSDALVCLFIQRADDAKRIYASIDFTGYTYFGSNSDSYYNFNEDVLKNSFQELLRQDNYDEFADISYVEMSACGFQVGRRLLS
ncbi:hypothetical protein U1Q18_045553 [Sarracenia purpurea var. burkii]